MGQSFSTPVRKGRVLSKLALFLSLDKCMEIDGEELNLVYLCLSRLTERVLKKEGETRSKLLNK